MAKARRTAAQKRATKKLVAMNKRKRKGTTKGMVRKTARRAFEGKRKRSIKRRISTTIKRTKRRNSMRKTSVKSILGSKTLQKVALGVGGGVMASLAIGAIAPQFSRFAAPAGAFALGGLEGVIGNFALGMLGNRTGGGTTAQNASPQMEVL
tara:strand:+ start:2164 stop:2619 length:456 start_codon:yes stop_codon:yes gene_type:complete